MYIGFNFFKKDIGKGNLQFFLNFEKILEISYSFLLCDELIFLINKKAYVLPSPVELGCTLGENWHLRVSDMRVTRSR